MQMTWIEALRFACWNANGVFSRKQELDHFLRQYESNTCVLTETHLRSS